MKRFLKSLWIIYTTLLFFAFCICPALIGAITENLKWCWLLIVTVPVGVAALALWWEFVWERYLQ